MTTIIELRTRHAEKKNWPLMRNDSRVASDGYIHLCRKDGEPWPCTVATLLAIVEAADKLVTTRTHEAWTELVASLIDVADTGKGG